MLAPGAYGELASSDLLASGIYARFDTSLGQILVELDSQSAPQTVAVFSSSALFPLDSG